MLGKLIDRANEWITWSNYNKPNRNAPLENQVAFLMKANHGAYELIALLLEELQSPQYRPGSAPQILLPNGVVFHEDIHVK